MNSLFPITSFTDPRVKQIPMINSTDVYNKSIIPNEISYEYERHIKNSNQIKYK